MCVFLFCPQEMSTDGVLTNYLFYYSLQNYVDQFSGSCRDVLVRRMYKNMFKGPSVCSGGQKCYKYNQLVSGLFTSR